MEKICNVCKGDITKVNGCTPSVFYNEDKQYDSIKVGDTGDLYEKCNENTRCGDCGAKFGYYHHAGCVNERCPVCGHQLR